MFRLSAVGEGILTFPVLAGTIDYMALEGWSWLDALHMTAITFTTVGYLKLRSLQTTSRVFNIFPGTMTYLFDVWRDSPLLTLRHQISTFTKEHR